MSRTEEPTPKQQRALPTTESGEADRCAACTAKISTTSASRLISELADLVIPLKAPFLQSLCPSCHQRNSKVLSDSPQYGVSSLALRSHGDGGTLLNDGDGRSWESAGPVTLLGKSRPAVRCSVHGGRVYFGQQLALDAFTISEVVDDLELWWLFPEMLLVDSATHPRDFARLAELGFVSAPQPSQPPPKAVLITTLSLKHIAACYEAKRPMFWRLMYDQIPATKESQELIPPPASKRPQDSAPAFSPPAAPPSSSQSGTPGGTPSQQQVAQKTVLRPATGGGLFRPVDPADMQSTLMSFASPKAATEAPRIAGAAVATTAAAPEQQEATLKQDQLLQNLKRINVIRSPQQQQPQPSPPAATQRVKTEPADFMTEDDGDIDDKVLSAMEREISTMRDQLSEARSLATAVHMEMQALQTTTDGVVPKAEAGTQPQFHPNPASLQQMVQPISAQQLQQQAIMAATAAAGFRTQQVPAPVAAAIPAPPSFQQQFPGAPVMQSVQPIQQYAAMLSQQQQQQQFQLQQALLMQQQQQHARQMPMPIQMSSVGQLPQQFFPPAPPLSQLQVTGGGGPVWQAVSGLPPQYFAQSSQPQVIPRTTVVTQPPRK